MEESSRRKRGSHHKPTQEGFSSHMFGAGTLIWTISTQVELNSTLILFHMHHHVIFFYISLIKNFCREAHFDKKIIVSCHASIYEHLHMHITWFLEIIFKWTKINEAIMIYTMHVFQKSFHTCQLKLSSRYLGTLHAPLCNHLEGLRRIEDVSKIFYWLLLIPTLKLFTSLRLLMTFGKVPGIWHPWQSPRNRASSRKSVKIVVESWEVQYGGRLETSKVVA